MKKTLRILLCILFLLALLVSAHIVSAEDGGATASSSTVAQSIVLGVGADETERNIAYFSSFSGTGEIRVAPAADVTDGAFPSVYDRFFAQSNVASNVPGKYAKSATIKRLCENTEYAYVIVEDGIASDIYYFSTDSFSDFEFIFVGDPQIGTAADGAEWQDTLQKLINTFDANLVISAGDQIVTPDSEEHYSYLLVDEMTKIAFAPTVGPVHDSSSATFSDHYNLPNKSDKYGVNETSANYWYTYNNTLFMHLNMSDTSAATNGEHESFMREAMAENPDVLWNIVIMHNSLYSTGMHGDPNYTYFDSEIGKYRPVLSPIFTELGIDVVLSGHDHVYVRTHMMDGTNVSGDTVVNNSVFAPDGTLYVCASSSTGSKFYDKTTSAEWIAYENYEQRKSAIRVEVTGEHIAIESYFLDDMSIFDRFKIEKVPHVCIPEYVEGREATCIVPGQKDYYICDCGKAYEDREGEVRIENLVSWSFIVAKGHTYKDATCTEPKICECCGVTFGKKLGHSYTAACDGECNTCGEVRQAAEHRDPDSDGVCNGCYAELSSGTKKLPTGLIIGICVGAAVLICAAVAVTVVIIFKKKAKK